MAPQWKPLVNEMNATTTERSALAALVTLTMLVTACSAGGNEHPPDTGATTLIYANLSESGPDREAIDAFNRTHEDVQIEVQDYFAEDGRSGRERLLTEILAGRMPDIIDLGHNYTNCATVQMPYRTLAEKGYLEDLWPYIERDSELGREGVVEAPLKAAEVDGGLYAVFSAVRVNTLAGAEQVVGSGYSWTLDELKEAFASMPEGASILEPSYKKRDMFAFLSPMLLDGYVDWETGRCTFDSEAFRGVLTFINSFPEQIEHPKEMDILADQAKRLAAGQQMLVTENASTPKCVQIIDTIFGGRGSFIGYPVEDGSTGSWFSIMGTQLAVSSACKDKEAAWAFVRQLLLPREDSETIGTIDFLPVNRADYERLINYSRSSALDVPFLRFGISAPPVQLHRVTAEEVERYEDFLNSIDKIQLYDETIYDIVRELSFAYFAGAKTLDETVDMIQNRVGLYVNENR